MRRLLLVTAVSLLFVGCAGTPKPAVRDAARVGCHVARTACSVIDRVCGAVDANTSGGSSE